MTDVALHVAAFAAMYGGFGAFALCQRGHWRKLGATPAAEGPPPAIRQRGRWLGMLGLLAGLALSLAAQGPSFGALLFGLLLGAASLAVSFTLTWRPRWLSPLRRLLIVAGPST